MTEFYDPRKNEFFKQKFFAYFFPFSRYFYIAFAHLILLIVIIIISIDESKFIKNLPLTTEDKQNNNWLFPKINFCVGKPTHIDIEHSYKTNCTLTFVDNIPREGEYACNFSRWYELEKNNDSVFSHLKNFTDICFNVEVINLINQKKNDNDNLYRVSTQLITNFVLEQNFKLQKVSQRTDIQDWMLNVPSEVYGSLNHRYDNRTINSGFFQMFPSTIKQTVVIYKTIEKTELDSDFLISFPIFNNTIFNKLYTKNKFVANYDYKIFIGNVGKYSIGESLCFDFNSTHDDCFTIFQTEVIVKIISKNEAQIDKVKYNGKEPYMWGLLEVDPRFKTFITLVFGKFLLGKAIIFIILLLIEATIFRYCSNKYENRSKNIELYSRLIKLQNKQNNKKKKNMELKEYKEPLMFDDEDDDNNEF